MDCTETWSCRYLFNPLTIAACLARPTSLFTNCAILYAIEKAVIGNVLTSMFALSLASYLSLYPVLLFPPLVLLCFDRQAQHKPNQGLVGFVGINLVVISGAILVLLYMSFAITGGSWEFLSSTYGVQLLLPDLTPNVGLWWYFFIEMFDSFREFFLGVFWLHLAGYVGGLTLRVRYLIHFLHPLLYNTDLAPLGSSLYLSLRACSVSSQYFSHILALLAAHCSSHFSRYIATFSHVRQPPNHRYLKIDV